MNMFSVAVHLIATLHLARSPRIQVIVKARLFLRSIRWRIRRAFVKHVFGIPDCHQGDQVQDGLNVLVAQVMAVDFCQMPAAVLARVEALFHPQQFRRRGGSAHSLQQPVAAVVEDGEPAPAAAKK